MDDGSGTVEDSAPSHRRCRCNRVQVPVTDTRASGHRLGCTRVQGPRRSFPGRGRCMSFLRNDALRKRPSCTAMWADSRMRTRTPLRVRGSIRIAAPYRWFPKRKAWRCTAHRRARVSRKCHTSRRVVAGTADSRSWTRTALTYRSCCHRGEDPVAGCTPMDVRQSSSPRNAVRPALSRRPAASLQSPSCPERSRPRRGRG